MKLVAKFLLLFALTSFVVLAGSTYLRVTREIEHFDTDLRQDVASYGSSLAHAVAALAVSAGTNEAVRLVKHANDSANHLLVRWVTLEERGPFDRPAAALRDLDALRRGELVLATVPATDRGSGFVVAYAPLDRELPGIGRTAIEVKESLEVRDRFVRGTIRETVITMVVAFGATTLLALISGVVVVGRPLRAVGLKVRRIGVGDLSGPLILRQRDEIGTIARELNAMCEQLAENQRRLDTEISARIAALEQLRHADRLATVGRLAAGIAHEIGTPLAVAAGRSKMIVSGEASGVEVVDNARIVVEQTQRISTIIRQLLDFARRRPAQKACIDLVALAQKTATLLEPISSKRGVSLAVSAPNSETAQAEVDAGQIEQALTNLIMNAVHASPVGKGRVEVSISRDPAASSPNHGGAEGDFISVAVSDNGPGMEADTVAHVFEPFFTTKDVGEGTGLGLPVAYGLVREHGGWIDVRSAVGKGSCFTIHLPAIAERTG